MPLLISLEFWSTTAIFSCFANDYQQKQPYLLSQSGLYKMINIVLAIINFCLKERKSKEDWGLYCSHTWLNTFVNMENDQSILIERVNILFNLFLNIEYKSCSAWTSRPHPRFQSFTWQTCTKTSAPVVSVCSPIQHLAPSWATSVPTQQRDLGWQ